MNQSEAANALGCSVGMISRLRSGDRTPGVKLMAEIRRVLSWSIDQQVAAIEGGTYHVEFTSRMDQRRLRRRMRRARGRVE